MIRCSHTRSLRKRFVRTRSRNYFTSCVARHKPRYSTRTTPGSLTTHSTSKDEIISQTQPIKMASPENVLAVFNSQVFHQRALRGLLSETEWAELKQCLESGKLLTRNLADRYIKTKVCNIFLELPQR